MKLFNRHEHMTEETMDQVSTIIRELMLEDAPSMLINKVYGLYDGYLYDGLYEQLVDFFRTKNITMVVYAADIYTKVSNYPLMEYQEA